MVLTNDAKNSVVEALQVEHVRVQDQLLKEENQGLRDEVKKIHALLHSRRFLAEGSTDLATLFGEFGWQCLEANGREVTATYSLCSLRFGRFSGKQKLSYYVFWNSSDNLSYTDVAATMQKIWCQAEGWIIDDSKPKAEMSQSFQHVPIYTRLWSSYQRLDTLTTI